MNWITLTVLAGVAAWFEYSYQRSRRKKNESPKSNPQSSVAEPTATPSLSPGSENDQNLGNAV